MRRLARKQTHDKISNRTISQPESNQGNGEHDFYPPVKESEENLQDQQRTFIDLNSTLEIDHSYKDLVDSRAEIPKKKVGQWSLGEFLENDV